MRADVREPLPKELAARGIDMMDGANRHLGGHYCTAFVPFIGPGLAKVLCEHHERMVGRDN